MAKVLEKNIDPKELAKVFITRELIKLLAENPKDAEWVKKQVSALEGKIGEEGIWQLLGELDDFKMKGVWAALTDTGFQWTKEEIALSELTMSGMSQRVDEVMFNVDRDFEKFAEYYHSHPELKKEFRDLEEKTERDSYPVFVRQSRSYPEFMEPIDGMRRTVLAALRGEKTVVAYVGRAVRAGKPRLQPNKAYFLERLYRKSPNKGEELDKVYEKLLAEIVEHFADGEEVLRKVIGYPARDKKLGDILEKTIRNKR